MNDDKMYIIDPLTMLCKLALIYFMPDGTKLSISHHVLHVQEYTCYQWVERMINGDTRRDMSNLYAPLIKVIKWYVLDGPEKIIMDETLKNAMNIIVNFCIKGLQKTQNVTYEKDMNMRITLQYFINLLRDASNGIWNEDNIVKMIGENNILSDKIKNNYDSKILNSIAKMMVDANDIHNSQNNDALVDCIHKLLLNRDEEFVKTMKEFNTIL